MTDHVGVRPADLTSHAARVEAIAGRVATAARTGAATRAGADAHGKLCVMVPVMLNTLQDILVGGITSAADALQDTGERLRTTASEYTDADRRGASALRRR
jgi:hypothetical protein